jgi:hypothetical protein
MKFDPAEKIDDQTALSIIREIVASGEVIREGDDLEHDNGRVVIVILRRMTGLVITVLS